MLKILGTLYFGYHCQGRIFDVPICLFCFPTSPSQQKFPNEGLANVVRNVFDFDSYNQDTRDVLIEALHKHGIPIGAKPNSVQLAKE